MRIIETNHRQGVLGCLQEKEKENRLQAEEIGDVMKYYTRRMDSLSDREIQHVSKLYSENYGLYSSESEINPGERIRYSAGMYRKNYIRDDYYISYAVDMDTLVGFAIYIRKRYSGERTITWVVQLVVDTEYRGNGVASRLLQSIWGFSNDYAWGLATTNPCTIKALENATFRKVSAREIHNRLSELKEIFDDVPFAEFSKLDVDDSISRINSHFYVDYSSVVTPERVESMGLGEIKPGYEWFAFVFSGQPLDDGLVRDKFLPSIRFSENKLMNAYSRMSLDQGWMQGTANEMDVFLDVYGKADGTILDLGCGRGRHSIELSQRGYNVHGIDFADNNIQIAGELSSNIDNQPNFDVVNVVSKDNISVLQDKYDAVLALYDVVGSYPDEESNREIILEAFNHLIDGGLLFLSVMNMELTSRLIRPDHQGNVAKDPSLLFRLEPIRIMQNTGDVFDPRYMVLDSESGLVYRKEQFVEDGDLSAEYVIRDKRYREKEIVSMLEEVGFHVDEVRRVRAGHFDEALSQDDLKAKELLVIARKR